MRDRPHPSAASTKEERVAVALTVYVAEPHVNDRRCAVHRLMERAAAAGLSGGTVLAAYEGFGRRHSHEPTFWHAADETPLCITFVDSPGRIDLVLRLVDEIIPDSVAVIEQVRALRYVRTNPHPEP